MTEYTHIQPACGVREHAEEILEIPLAMTKQRRRFSGARESAKKQTLLIEY